MLSEIEGSFGFLTQQIKGVHRDLLAFQAITKHRFDKVEGRLEKVEGRLGGVEGRLDRVEKGVRTLRDDMPAIVASTMREVLRERPAKSRKT
jgi:hypothetical protein